MSKLNSNSLLGNRNSTPDASSAASLRPPAARTIGSGHHLRASADMAAFNSSPLAGRIRPSSEVWQQSHKENSTDADEMDKAYQQWLADLDHFDLTLEEMAAATLDQDFKDELNAIEQWFRVLSEAERTAALYALLQQTTQVQIRFFITVLQQMARSHPMSAMLSPANFEKVEDAMSNRLSDAMKQLTVEGSRNSFGRPVSAVNKRNSALDPSTISQMFPDAAAAIATQRAKFAQHAGNQPGSNRNSAAFGDRPQSLLTPTISTPLDAKDGTSNIAAAWSAREQPITRPKSSSEQQPMGQFMQAPGSAALRSSHPMDDSGIRNTTLTSTILPEIPTMSPYPSGNWASMVNTPMVPTFNATAAATSQADMVANATAMKLAALSTVSNRIALDDAKKYRRARGPETGPGGMQMPMSPSLGGFGVDNTAAAFAAMQAQQSALGRRSPRPASPSIALQGAQWNAAGFMSPQQNGFLGVYDSSGLLNGQPGFVTMGAPSSHDGYLSDHSGVYERGRSPRGRRATSKPPEDPTDPSLLQDIPAWLRSLRLHKYTDNLKDLKWEELVELDDAALDARGVNALGARRKMLKVFEQVKEAKGDGKL